ncbi:unnamed protein product [Acanthocheilonema viteae]|uniref:CSD domain-containing protein n=1 Tax=Acanthocheilonema viteae TaxID=6277 RepID=A0A498S6N3_ACAVI|nr:unnamed protein product [Acanthocheilonema viteae]
MSSDVPAPLVRMAADEKVDGKENIDTNGNIQDARNEDKGENNSTKGLRRSRIVDDERRMAWEIEQAKKPILEKGVKGRVKWYSVRFHYGFIARDDGKGNDTAIAKSRIIKYYLRTLGDGEEVLFDIVEGKRGPEAANVTGPNGAEVRGSKYHNFQFYSFRRRIAYIREKVAHQENDKYRRDEQNRKTNEKREDDNADLKKLGPGNHRRFRHFKARHPPFTTKKSNGYGDYGKGEGGGGDSKKRNNHSNMRNGAHSEGRGDVRQSTRKNDATRHRSTATTDAGQSETEAVEKEVKNANAAVGGQ